MAGYLQTNLGPFVLTILQQPEKVMNGTRVSAATEMTSIRELVAAWSQATGNEAMFVQCTIADYERLWPGWGGVERPMLQFFNDFGAQVATSEDKILTAADLSVPVQEARNVAETIGMAVNR